MRNGLQKAIWLYVMSEGKAATPDDVAENFGIGRQRANVMLQNMATRGRNFRRERVEGKAAFAIAGDCTVPVGVTLDELFGRKTAAEPERRPVNSVFQLGAA